MVAYQAPRATDPDSFTLDVLQFVLSVGASSRLNRGLVYGRRCAVSAGCDWAWRKGPGMFSFTLELPVGGDPAVAEQGLQEELERIISEGISDLELQKAQNNLLAHLWREGSTNGGRAESLATYEALLGSWQEANAMAARYRAIDADQVREAARRYLDPRRRSVATLKPGVVS